MHVKAMWNAKGVIGLGFSVQGYISSSQNSGPFLVPLNIRCRNQIYKQKGPIILRTTYIGVRV